jgi:hypothetical protein
MTAAQTAEFLGTTLDEINRKSLHQPINIDGEASPEATVGRTKLRTLNAYDEVSIIEGYLRDGINRRITRVRDTGKLDID